MLLKHMKNWSKKISYIYSFLQHIKQNWNKVYINPFETNALLI